VSAGSPPLDRRGDADSEGFHTGSVGVALALRATRPVGSLGGHSHRPAYDPGLDDGAPPPHRLGRGFRRVVDATADGGGFAHEFHHEG
jgi:hypothetical protein